MLILVALLCSVCEERAAEPGATVTNMRVFEVRGVVKELPPGGKSVVIKHEDIPNYMRAMTMEFRVPDTNELRELAPGDQVKFRMVVTTNEGWIEGITRIGREAVSTSAPTNIIAYRPPLKMGDTMPNVALTNELGEAISLNQFRGQALALTFIFTRCPFPEFCPRMSNQFGTTEQILSAKANAPTNWHLLSISFDPANDSPAVLKRYGEMHNYNPGRWSFATGSQGDILKLARRCDLTIQPDGAGFTHNLRTVVVDASGKVKDVLIGNEWTPEELANDLIAAASVAGKLEKK